jgi:hypothetical protein
MGTMSQGALRELHTTLRLTIGDVLLLGSVVHTSVLVLVVHENLKFQQAIKYLDFYQHGCSPKKNFC